MQSNIENMTSVSELRTQGTIPNTQHGHYECRLGISCHQNSPRPIATLSIGVGLCDDLRWRSGDRIEILFDNRHLFVRRKQNGPYLLKAKGRHRLTASFTVYQSMPFGSIDATLKTKTCQAEVKDDGVLIEWPSA